MKIAAMVSLVLCMSACGGEPNPSAQPAESGRVATAGAEAPATPPIAVAAPETWWMEDAEGDAPDGLEANASSSARRDGAVVTLNGATLFPDGFGMTTLFAPEHPMHAMIQEPDAQWRFLLRSGMSEAVMQVPVEAARDWMGSPPVFIVHQTGRRWPAVVLVAPGRAASEVRASFMLGDVPLEQRRPVVAASTGVVPVLFLRCPEARVEVSLNGRGTEFSAQSLAIHVAPLTTRLQPGRNTLTLTSTLTRDDDEREAEGDRTTPTVEYLLVVGDTAIPGRVELGAGAVESHLAFEMPR